MIEINLINREEKSQFYPWERFCRFSVIYLPNNKLLTLFIKGYGQQVKMTPQYNLKKVQIVANQKEN